MFGDNDLIKFYFGCILVLVVDMLCIECLVDLDVMVKKCFLFCGLIIVVDVILQDGKIFEYGQDVKVCVLGQVVVFVVGVYVVGFLCGEIEIVWDVLKDMLKNDGFIFVVFFEDFEVLCFVCDYKNCYVLIMFVFEVIFEVFDQVEYFVCV